ncbi:PEP/pyruvate-binding domain-containing protein [Ectobacillus panaciterrae]|uniref:PEP/pyruvate-binding domain-containing protein n=1 Tax=Ectobacillus panaciterrae TaxID=363872 RepID=UPI00048C624B|nr:PEP/pyruvate-binding domain-containing protein [Ectobacillus panaciterrae]
MDNTVKNFKELTPDLQPYAGGKGGMLSKMFQEGYPVPEGFIVLPSAFQEAKLSDISLNKIYDYLNAIRKNNESALFAVRSSALSEDSGQASFAGEFETVLNVKTDEEVLNAIYKVYQSTQSERVKVYSTVQGIDHSHQIAIVVQLMVQSEISGVLFTADPITGSRLNMTGNYVYGLGEQLVSGEANAHSFTIMRLKGKYAGPDEFQKYASTLYKLAARLEKELNCPQDMEWAVSKGKLYILQARPITTLNSGNLETYEWNDTLLGDFLWTNTNIGEAIPDVMTPLTWSLLRALDEESNVVPGYYMWSGNICGRAYTNISHALSLYTVFGMNPKGGKMAKLISDALGEIPEGINVPLYPFSRLGLLKEMAVKLKPYLLKLNKAMKNIREYLEDTPTWCVQTTEKIRYARTKQELLVLWKEELYPYICKAWFTLLAGGRKSGRTSSKLTTKLTKLVGKEDANLLLSNLRGNAGLASLGPVIGISNVIKGKMSREEYLMQQGHRGPHEFELSIPHPAEDIHWLESQIEEYMKSGIDAEVLLNKQHTQYEGAFTRFQERFPNKVKWLKTQLAKASEYAALRETTRSEFVRVYRVARAFILRTGELTGIKDDVFFLYVNEVVKLLSGDDVAVTYIQVRRENYEKYKALPPLPSIINGRFDPFKWAEDPDRRVDYFDTHMPIKASDSETLKGFAGAAGRIEGSVRVLTSPEEGDTLLSGEILVASTTNVGWTPLFPKAAAIITDIGAPLSHAAIVARELGIPAIVGCGNATTRLKTGDRVIVDGGQGVVQILD